MSPEAGTLLLSPSERSRAEEVDRLAAQGPASVSGLVQRLTDPSWPVRRRVIAALAGMGTPAGTALAAVLRSQRDDETRLAAAVDALVANRDEIREVVVELLDDPNPAVVADAAQILGRRQSSEAVPQLAALLQRADDNVAVAAIEALGRIGGRSVVEALVAATRSNRFFRVFPAIDVLGRTGDPRAIEPLTELLSSPTYVLEAARALGRTGDRGAVSPLAALLGSPTVATVRVAALALHDLQQRALELYGDASPVEQALRRTGRSPLAARQLTQAVAGADAAEKAAIAFVLGIVGSESAAGTLRSLLDEMGEPSRAAAEALKRLGRESDEQLRDDLRVGSSGRRAVLLPLVTTTAVAPEVIACLSDPEPAVRVLACDALARVGAASGVRALFGLLADPSPVVVPAAVGAIQALGSDESINLALDAATHGEPAVRRSALRILAYFGAEQAVPIFLEVLRGPDLRLRETGLAGLPFFDDHRAFAAILEAARSDVARLRGAAMRALGQSARRDPRVAAYLLVGLGDPDAWVRYYACQALGRLGFEAAVQAIIPLLADQAGQVRVAAVEALSHFRDDAAFAALCRVAESADEPDVQRAALVGLGIGKRPEALSVLLRAVRGADPATRLLAISALAGGLSPEVVPTLRDAAHDADDNVRAAAIGFLGASPVHEATAALLQLLRERVETERVLAALAVPADGRVDALIQALGPADDELAPLIASALARARRPDASAGLLRALTASAAPGRKAAASALASVSTREAMRALEKAAQSDADPEVRRVCALLFAS